MGRLQHIWINGWALSVCLVLGAISAPASRAAGPTTAPSMIKLNFPENVEIKVLADYVGQRQGINFIYGEGAATRRLTLKTPQEIPAESLMTLLQSAMKMNGLTLARTDVPGTMRIEVARQLASVSTGPPTAGATPGAATQPAEVVTRLFELEHARPQRIVELITPFSSGPQLASITPMPELGLVIVTDYVDNLKRIGDIIALVDRSGHEVAVRFVPVVNLEAVTLKTQVTEILAGKTQVRGAAKEAPAVSVLADERTNQIVLVGSTDEVNDAAALVKSLDVPLGLETKVYTFKVASPEEVDQLIKGLIGDLTAKRLYRSRVARDAGLLIVSTTPEIHQQIEALSASLDKPAEDAQKPIRFYKLSNAKAAEVIRTLKGLAGNAELAGESVDGVSAAAPPPAPSPIAYKGPDEATINNRGPAPGASGKPATSRVEAVVLQDETRILADEPSNTIIVVAKPSLQDVYEKLIRRLDVRRPQVLVEATIVAIDTSNNFQLGVEISKSTGLRDKGRILNFSSFGLSDVNPDTGALALRPGLGFNGAMISADIADVVIRALSSDTRAKVLSKPHVLINDNATGKLLSDNEEPFSTVTASGVAGATTTTGGYVSAGTNIEITPQISEGEHLNLKYKIELSSFTAGTGSAELPPAKQKNSLESEATIPDGYTIVVGGLTHETYNKTVDRVPILGQIPVLEYLFSNRTIDKEQLTLFLFIRAVILRDDQFADLKTLSGTAAGKAGLPGDLPASEPVAIQ